MSITNTEPYFHSERPFVATSRTIANTAGLSELLGHPIILHRIGKNFSHCEGVIAWGLKPSAVRAANVAAQHQLPLLRLEDGFLRSVATGSIDSPLAIVQDDLGIYYDATTPSRLEQLIPQALSADQRYRAQALICLWRTARISKYNHARSYTAQLLPPYILVVDQVAGDASITYGLADANRFQAMLNAALHDFPTHTLVLKIHPEVLQGQKQGHFDLSSLTHEPRVMVVAEDVHPVSLLEHADAVYCVSSQLGFEGLLWGKPVHTFGMPFYAGWGLTHDDLPAPTRRTSVSLENLVYATLIAYPRYLDPETLQRCEIERLINWMGLQRNMRERFPPVIDALGFSFYKRPIVRRFFQGSQVFFDRPTAKRPEHGTIAIWGKAALCTKQAVIRLEDGFIRSVGLGADLIPPLSWAMDSRGLYYDANEPSDLELILQNAHVDLGQIMRAGHLREQLVAHALTKYNVGAQQWQRPQTLNSTQKIILVPGQVETDASLQYGALGIRKNLDLLKAVRAANPDSYILYKPHPDVVAGLRRRGHAEEEIHHWCDEQVSDVAMGHLLTQVDEVHTLTSLAGFEALLREKKVVCYGLPFYAGWGLTEDRLVLNRRTRQLTLDELVAGVLILYPTYISRTTGRFTTPERALTELLAWQAQTPRHLPWWRIGLRALLQLELGIKTFFNSASD